jgi:hypothetical protein
VKAPRRGLSRTLGHTDAQRAVDLLAGGRDQEPERDQLDDRMADHARKPLAYGGGIEARVALQQIRKQRLESAQDHVLRRVRLSAREDHVHVVEVAVGEPVACRKELSRADVSIRPDPNPVVRAFEWRERGLGLRRELQLDLRSGTLRIHDLVDRDAAVGHPQGCNPHPSAGHGVAYGFAEFSGVCSAIRDELQVRGFTMAQVVCCQRRIPIQSQTGDAPCPSGLCHYLQQRDMERAEGGRVGLTQRFGSVAVHECSR